MSTFDQPLPPFNASDPSASFLSSSCLDFLLIEIVPMAYRVANEVDAAASSESIPKSSSAETTAAGTTGAADSTTAARASGRLDEEEERDAVFYRLETLGYRVGLGLVERYAILVLSFAFFLYLSLGSSITLRGFFAVGNMYMCYACIHA